MQVTRAEKALRYTAPEHDGMAMFRLQGREATDTRSVWVGYSHILPGGGTSLTASQQEKIYIVIAGDVTIGNGEDEVTLGPMDSVAIAPGEPRRIENRSARPASLILIMEETLA